MNLKQGDAIAPHAQTGSDLITVVQQLGEDVEDSLESRLEDWRVGVHKPKATVSSMAEPLRDSRPSKMQVPGKGGEMRKDQEPNLADVAALAGVSPTTVSRVLNNRGYLSQQTKDKVADAIKELNYRPNEVARALLGSKTNIVGIIVPTVAHPFFGELAAALEHHLAEHGYRTLLCNSMGRSDRERGYLRQLEGRRVDGLITGAHNALIPEYETTRLPIVMVDRNLAGHIPNVRADNRQGGRLATELLIARGCSRPLLVTSSLGPSNLREAGYREAVAVAGIEPLAVSVKFGTPEPEYSTMLHAGLEDLQGSFDGVFATDDLTACNVANWARSRGLRVPEDLKIIGFDGTSAVRTAAAWLSTVVQPIDAMAQKAVELLVAQIDAEGGTRDDEEPSVFELPVSVVESASTSLASSVATPEVPPSIWSI